MKKLIFLLALASCSLANAVSAAELLLINADNSDEGLNDATEVAPTGENSATTLGEQRQAVIEHALDYLGSVINPSVDIRVSVRFSSLWCDADSATLGGGGPSSYFYDFPGAPEPDVNYPAPLAAHHAGQDLDPESPHIELEFNQEVDGNDQCMEGVDLYYGLDGAEPEGTVNFYAIVLHEVMHGLGFITFMDVEGNTPNDHSDPFLDKMWDPSYNSGALADMSPSSRGWNLLNRDLMFYGDEVIHRGEELDAGYYPIGQALNGLDLRAPNLYNPQSYSPYSSFSHWSPELAPGVIMNPYFQTPETMELAMIEKAALYELGWSVELPVQDRDGDGVADRHDGFPEDPERSGWPWISSAVDNIPDEWKIENDIDVNLDGTFFRMEEDRATLLQNFNMGTDPRELDTDGDGVWDLVEFTMGHDPLDESDCPQIHCGGRLEGKGELDLSVDYPVSYLDSESDVYRTYMTAMTPSVRGDVVALLRVGNGSSLVRIDDEGTINRQFGRNGFLRLSEHGATGEWGGADRLLEDSQGRLYIIDLVGFMGEMEPSDPPVPIYEYQLFRLLADGSKDTSFNPVAISVPGINPYPVNLALDSQGRILLGWDGNYSGSSNLEAVVERYLPNGTLDRDFGNQGRFTLRDDEQSYRLGSIDVDAMNRAYLHAVSFGQSNGIRYYRLNDSGKIDQEYAGGFYSIENGERDYFDEVINKDGTAYVFSSGRSSDNPTLDDYIVRELSSNGEVAHEYRLEGLPLRNSLDGRCIPKGNGWVCVFDPGDDDLAGGQFLADRIYIKEYDENFQATTDFKAIEKLSPGGGVSSRFENLSFRAMAISPGNSLLLPSELSYQNLSQVGLRIYGDGSEWRTDLGDNGRQLIRAVGPSSLTESVVVDEKRRWVTSRVVRVHYERYRIELNRFFATGRKDASFGVGGAVTLDTIDRGEIPVVLAKQFNSEGELFILLVADEQMKLYRVGKTYGGDGAVTIGKIYSSDLQDEVIHGGQMMAIHDDEIFLSYTQSPASSNGVFTDPVVNILHLDRRGQPLDRLWSDGLLQYRYDGWQTPTVPLIKSLSVSENDELEFILAPPIELEEENPTFFRVPLQGDGAGTDQALFSLAPSVDVWQASRVADTDHYLIVGATCLVELFCPEHSLMFFSMVDRNGVPIDSFNGGQPLLIGAGQAKPFLTMEVFQFGDEFLAVATENQGQFLRTEDGGFGPTYVNAGNALYVISFDRDGKVLSEQPFHHHNPGFETYNDCTATRDQQVICTVGRNLKYDVGVIQVSGTPDTDSEHYDSDGDGIPDLVELQYGLDPHDPTDAQDDLSGNGRSNLTEYLEGFDLSVGKVELDIAQPTDRTVNAVGAYTRVDFDRPELMSSSEATLSLTSDFDRYFPPGEHELLWRAEDDSGGTVSRIQRISVVPLFSLSSTAYVDRDDKFRVHGSLNGEAPLYPVHVGVDKEGARGKALVNFDDRGLFLTSGTESFIDGRFMLLSGESLSSFDVVVDGLAGARLAGAGRTVVHVADNFVPTDLMIELTQNERPVSEFQRGHGAARVELTGHAGPSAQLDWSASDSALLEAAAVDHDSLSVDLDGLSEGVYRLGVRVSQDGGERLITDHLRIAPSVGSGDDCDGPGARDQGQTRVPDCVLDDDRRFVLPSGGEWYDVIQAESGLNLRLGVAAYAKGVHSPLLNRGDVFLYGGNDGSMVNTADQATGSFRVPDRLFDVEVRGLSVPGGSAPVVFPLPYALDENSILTVFDAEAGWREFAVSDQDIVRATQRIEGVCPAPGHSAYHAPWKPGDDCIEVYVTDGGRNDVSAQANGVVALRVGVGRLDTETDGQDETEGGSSSSPGTGKAGDGSQSRGGGLMVVLPLLLFLYLCSAALVRLRRKPGKQYR